MSIESLQTNIEQSSNTQTMFRAITFTLNEQIYALDIFYIRDITIGKRIYRIPNSDPALIGVTNIRGEILPIYSLKNILGLTEPIDLYNQPVSLHLQNDEYLMIIKYDTYLFAIIVDQVDKNISITSENYNEGKYLAKWSKDTIFTGIIIDEKDNILLIDVAALIHLLIKKAKQTNISL